MIEPNGLAEEKLNAATRWMHQNEEQLICRTVQDYFTTTALFALAQLGTGSSGHIAAHAAAKEGNKASNSGTVNPVKLRKRVAFFCHSG